MEGWKSWPKETKAQQQLESITKLLSEYTETMKRHGGIYNFSMVNMDDETYHITKFDMPIC